MPEQLPYVITISRMLGSGGAYLGKHIASRLGILYADREIVRKAAETLHISEEVGESLDEKMTPLLQSLFQSFEYGSPYVGYIPPVNVLPTDNEFHEAESQVIKSVVQTSSAVIVGRGGFHILRDNPRHLSVFLHADIELRLKRIREAYNVSQEEARRMIETSDRQRSHYLHHLTGVDWTDARQYHLSLDTGKLGLECAEKIIMDSLPF